MSSYDPYDDSRREPFNAYSGPRSERTHNHNEDFRERGPSQDHYRTYDEHPSTKVPQRSYENERKENNYQYARQGKDQTFDSEFRQRPNFPLPANSQWNQHQEEGRFRGRGPKGHQRTDERIKEEVCDVLCDNPYIDASDIEVLVQAGEVTLSGRVDDRKQKRVAMDIIENLRGVRDVHNQLMIKQEKPDPVMS